jgi:acetyl esterase/lipase
MYSLVAKPFIEKGLAVAVVGYRIWPTGDAVSQVEDLELAASVLTHRYPGVCIEESDLGVCLMGHSSGAHILAMMMVERLRMKMESDRWGFSLKGLDGLMRVDSIVGIAGPYDIARHFQFEASRGVEHLSPMQPACGGHLAFHRNSPMLQLSRFLSRSTKNEVEIMDKSFPPVALVHGLIDDTVPVESSQEAARILATAGVTKCDQLYLPQTGHAQTVMELMLGGPTRDALLEWIENQARTKSATAIKVPPPSEIMANILADAIEQTGMVSKLADCDSLDSSQ